MRGAGRLPDLRLGCTLDGEAAIHTAKVYSSGRNRGTSSRVGDYTSGRQGKAGVRGLPLRRQEAGGRYSCFTKRVRGEGRFFACPSLVTTGLREGKEVPLELGVRGSYEYNRGTGREE
jgi:hypothetical protein